MMHDDSSPPTTASARLRVGSLFSGVGGLDMAVEAFFEAETVWHCEWDEAPSKVLAARWPGVPNHRDVTTVDWATVEPVDILCGGFPCQDVSLAGRRRGMKEGTRSGLWAEYLNAIDAIRPDWVVIENVRGLISARAYGPLEPCSWCMGDGDDEYHLRALDAVIAGLSDVGYDATWTPLRASDVGAPHSRYRFFILAWPSADTDGSGFRGVGRVNPIGRDADRRCGEDGTGDGDEPEASLTLLPTPVVSDGSGGPADRANRPDYGGTPFSTQLGEIAQLLPTPRTTDMNGAAAHGTGGMDLRTSVSLLAAASTTDWGQYAGAVSRWEAVFGRPAPAPVRHDGKGGKPRLNPELPEWMMGWPAGWVTDPKVGLTRAEQLKAAGNGVVPQQAYAALGILWSRVLEAVAA